MDKYQLKFTLQQRILDLFYDYPTTIFNQRDIARALSVTPTAVAKALKSLEQFIEIKKDFPLVIHLKEPFIEQKRVSNFKKIYDSGLASFLDKQYPGTTIILFGSYARGEDTEKSDIDIAIIGSKEKSLVLQEFSKPLARPINIQHFPDWKISGNLKESVINGIVLKGYIEL